MMINTENNCNDCYNHKLKITIKTIMMIKIKNVLITIMRITAVKYNKERKILKKQ